MLPYPVSNQFRADEILYFDIETTGLSSATSYLYLIGMFTVKDNIPLLTQCFSENISEEKDLLIYFFKMLKNYKLLVHYNGTSFDIPYLLNKAKQYSLPYSFANIESLDIYKEIKPLKKLLGLDNLKQKTVEQFLGIHRDDPFSGEDLIGIYAQYVGRKHYENLHQIHNDHLHSPSQDYINPPADSGLPRLPADESTVLISILLLHNEEDLTGLIGASSMLHYLSIIQGNFNIVKANFIKEKNFLEISFMPTKGLCDLNIEKCLKKISLAMFLPYNYSDTEILDEQGDKISPSIKASLSLSIDMGIIKIPCLKGELKLFFTDYKEYYYLPVEDMAIHKSVAEYVDKKFRKRATKKTCYQKKQGYFLPQPGSHYTPDFKREAKDKATFFEITNEILEDLSKLKDYLVLLLTS